VQYVLAELWNFCASRRMGLHHIEVHLPFAAISPSGQLGDFEAVFCMRPNPGVGYYSYILVSIECCDEIAELAISIAKRSCFVAYHEKA
jgi:hypothetical protein